MTTSRQSRPSSTKQPRPTTSSGGSRTATTRMGVVVRGRLLDLSELPALLGAKPIRSHLVHALVQLARITQRRARASVGKTHTHVGSRRSSSPDSNDGSALR